MIFCLSGRELSLSTFKNPEATIATLQCSDRVRVVLSRAVTWEPSARFANAHELTAALRRAAGQHLTEGAPGAAHRKTGRERGTQDALASRTWEQPDQLPVPDLGQSLQWRSIADSLEILISSLPVHAAMVSVFGGTGIAMALSGLLLILHGILGFAAEFVMVLGTACAGLGFSVSYIAARSISERAHALAAASHGGARLRAQATVVSVVAGVGMIATVLFKTLAPVWW